jgi:hypothetical protein
MYAAAACLGAPLARPCTPFTAQFLTLHGLPAPGGDAQRPDGDWIPTEITPTQRRHRRARLLAATATFSFIARCCCDRNLLSVSSCGTFPRPPLSIQRWAPQPHPSQCCCLARFKAGRAVQSLLPLDRRQPAMLAPAPPLAQAVLGGPPNSRTLDSMPVFDMLTPRSRPVFVPPVTGAWGPPRKQHQWIAALQRQRAAERQRILGAVRRSGALLKARAGRKTRASWVPS